MAISNPVGYGIGSSGLAGRLNTGTTDSEALIGDNGYLELLTAFGVPGGLLLSSSLFPPVAPFIGVFSIRVSG